MTFHEYKSERRDGIKWALWGVLALFLVGGVWYVLGTAATVISAPSRVLTKTLGTDNIIANYEWFKRQYQDVQAQDQKIVASQAALFAFEQSAGPRNTWHFEDRQEQQRLMSVVLGLKNQRASMVAEYNARTQMMNRDMFRSSDLPAEIQ